MADRPDARELLAVALAALKSEILPHVPAETRLVALMLANALGIAERELAQDEGWSLDAAVAQLYDRSGGAGDGDILAQLVADLRRGRWDDDADLYELLLRDAQARVGIANPRYV